MSEFAWAFWGDFYAGSNRSGDAHLGMIMNLTVEEEQAVREKVSKFLAEAKTDDEHKLAVQGLRYLRTQNKEVEA